MRIALALSWLALVGCGYFIYDLGGSVVVMQERLAQMEAGAANHEHDLSGMASTDHEHDLTGLAPEDHVHDLSGLALFDHSHADLERRIVALESRPDLTEKSEELSSRLTALEEGLENNRVDARLRALESDWAKLTGSEGLDANLLLRGSIALVDESEEQMAMLHEGGLHFLADEIMKAALGPNNLRFFGSELLDVGADYTGEGLFIYSDSGSELLVGLARETSGFPSFLMNSPGSDSAQIEIGFYENSPRPIVQLWSDAGNKIVQLLSTQNGVGYIGAFGPNGRGEVMRGSSSGGASSVGSAPPVIRRDPSKDTVPVIRQGEIAPLSAWRKVRSNMSASQVRAVLGDPTRVERITSTYFKWHYDGPIAGSSSRVPAKGVVSFLDGNQVSTIQMPVELNN